MSNCFEPLLLELYSSLARYERLIVTYSGGKDSHVLLHLMAQSEQLKPRLAALHVNHGLSPQADAWGKHCSDICDALAVPLEIHLVDAHPKSGESPEEAARNARYTVFDTHLSSDDCLLMAHHQNDQAETLLLQLFRGAGLAGLAAMPAWSTLSHGGRVYRPLLSQSRAEIDNYARLHQLQWVNDESNQDQRFRRNFIRHQILPLIQQQWPAAVTNISRSASHCAEALLLLESQLEGTMSTVIDEQARISLNVLATMGQATQRHVLRYWLQQCQIKVPNARKLDVLRTQALHAKEDAMPLTSWDGGEVRRYRGHLYAMRPQPHEASDLSIRWTAWPCALNLQDGRCLNASRSVSESGEEALWIPEDATIEVRFRQGGERIRLNEKGGHQALKKLFQQWGVPPWLRASVPLLYVNDELAAVIGHAVAAGFKPPVNGPVWCITVGFHSVLMPE